MTISLLKIMHHALFFVVFSWDNFCVLAFFLSIHLHYHQAWDSLASLSCFSAHHVFIPILHYSQGIWGDEGMYTRRSLPYVLLQRFPSFLFYLLASIFSISLGPASCSHTHQPVLHPHAAIFPMGRQFYHSAQITTLRRTELDHYYLTPAARRTSSIRCRTSPVRALTLVSRPQA